MCLLQHQSECMIQVTSKLSPLRKRAIWSEVLSHHCCCSRHPVHTAVPWQPNHVMVELAARSFRITGILWSRIFNPPLAVRAAIVFFSSSRHMPVRASTAKTGLLIHGCHLGAKGWHNVMWGDARTQRLGRWVDPVVNISNSNSEYLDRIPC